MNYFPVKRLLTSLFSLFIAFLLCTLLFELGPGNRKEYDQVKHFDSGFSTDSANSKEEGQMKKALSLILDRINTYSHGDFGESLTFQNTVTQVLFKHTQVSLMYWAYSLLLTFLLGSLLAFCLSSMQGALLPSVVKAFSLFLYKTPTFLIGLFLLYLANRYLPASCFKLEETPSLVQFPFQAVAYLWAPVLTYLAFTVPSFSLQMYSWIEEENRKEYLVALKARGFSTTARFTRHVLPNLFQLLLTSLPLLLRNLFILSIAVEITFQIHGFGFLSHLSIRTRDTPQLLFSFIFVCFVEMSLSFACEMLVLFLVRRRTGFAHA